MAFQGQPSDVMRDSVEPLVHLLGLAEQALKPEVLDSVVRAKEHRLSLRAYATSKIGDSAFGKKVCSDKVASTSLFGSSDVKNTVASPEQGKQRFVKTIPAKRQAEEEVSADYPRSQKYGSCSTLAGLLYGKATKLALPQVFH